MVIIVLTFSTVYYWNLRKGILSVSVEQGMGICVSNKTWHNNIKKESLTSSKIISYIIMYQHSLFLWYNRNSLWNFITSRPAHITIHLIVEFYGTSVEVSSCFHIFPLVSLPYLLCLKFNKTTKNADASFLRKYKAHCPKDFQ